MKRLTVDQIEARIKRLTARMTRTANALAKMQKMLARRKAQERTVAQTQIDKVVTAPIIAPPPAAQANRDKEVAAFAPADELAIPGFLQRAGKIGGLTPDDLEAIATIEAEQASKRIAKAKASAERRKADRNGDRKKMPLAGKAALAAIKKKAS